MRKRPQIAALHGTPTLGEIRGSFVSQNMQAAQGSIPTDPPVVRGIGARSSGQERGSDVSKPRWILILPGSTGEPLSVRNRAQFETSR